MRNQSRTITKIEMKREALIGFSKYTHEEINAMSDDKVKEIYHNLFG